MVFRARLCGPFVALLLLAPAGWHCVRPPAPPTLRDLRAVVAAAGGQQAREAAPDLLAEAERSLAQAESARAARDLPRARWQATLGLLQVKLARTAARRHRAGQRMAAAQAAHLEAEESLARYQFQRDHALAELARLRQAASSDPQSPSPRLAAPAQ